MDNVVAGPRLTVSEQTGPQQPPTPTLTHTHKHKHTHRPMSLFNHRCKEYKEEMYASSLLYHTHTHTHTHKIGPAAVSTLVGFKDLKHSFSKHINTQGINLPNAQFK